MSFQINRGLFLLEFVDHYAVLGVPIDADAQAIRKRYLKIARRLHPDSCGADNADEKQRSSEFLSKLVNPSWEKLSQEKDRTEYELLLKLKGQQAAKQSSFDLGNLGKELSTASNPDHFYRTSLKGLADRQYDRLDQLLEITGQISELNMIYLIRKNGQVSPTQNANKNQIFTGSNLPDSSQSPVSPQGMARPAAPPRRESVVDQYYRRGEEYAAKNNFAQAVLELRDGLKIEPNNSRCHALLGMIYLRQNQATMARIHVNKALESDPHNEIALVAKQRLEQGPITAGSTAAKGAKTSAKAPPQANSKANPKAGKPNDKNDKNDGGGLFGLFGGKKK
jgi:curved DNA-binding protein CbpA